MVRKIKIPNPNTPPPFLVDFQNTSINLSFKAVTISGETIFHPCCNSALSTDSHTVLPYLSIYLLMLFPISSKLPPAHPDSQREENMFWRMT